MALVKKYYFKKRYTGKVKVMNFNFLLESPGNGGLDGAWIYIVMIVLIIGMFWFSSRSQKKREKEAADMRDSLAIGDEVTTIGGIIGKVVSIKGDTFVLETTKDRTKIRFLKGAIRTIDVKAADLAAVAIEAKAEDAAATESEAKTEDVIPEVKEDEKKD